MNNITIFDVADTFLYFQSMTHKKLQKLCYYAQAWYLALYKIPLVPNEFEAWIHGPVCPDLYNEYKGSGWNDIPNMKTVSPKIDEKIFEFISTVFDTYGEFSGDQLEILTHSEKPWLEARGDLEEWEPSNNKIDENTMLVYYWNIYEKNQNV